MTRDRETVQDVFRNNVLRALDQSVDECFGSVGRNDRGAADVDLPRLFEALDTQIDVVCKRFNITLVD
jgi:hypothetical protein